jgi:hypothetical protein
MPTDFSGIIDREGSDMLVAQAIVEGGLLDSIVSTIRSGVEEGVYYVRTGNTKWFLIGLAVVMAVLLFKPKR